jgi:1-aminocyclopropane-1-carboxylate deaminase/D-cysteine desulfhydrase-like pyridoxal-dependent ACC family enzyme
MRLGGALPRERLGVFPTPLLRAHRLERATGCGPMLIKRDDLAGFGLAGNKTRPLEFLLGAARARNADVLVTGGGPGSNFCPAAAMAARAVGLECELVVWGDPHSPNLALARAAGARLLPTGGTRSDTDRAAVDEQITTRAEELHRAGRRPFPVPRGGSTDLGAVGFAVAAEELADQLADQLADRNIPELIVLALGSGGSCAGLLAGLAARRLDIPVLGVSVSRPPHDIERTVHRLAEGCARLLGHTRPTTRLEVVDARGPGFGVATDTERDRARLALHTEGLLLDETYGAEAFTVALERACQNRDGSRTVLFWHTGGVVGAVGSCATAADTKTEGP